MSFAQLLPSFPRLRRGRPWKNLNAPAEVLEDRVMLTAWVGAVDDTAWIHHGTHGYSSSGSVLENDGGIDMETTASIPLTAAMVGGSPQGFNLNSDGTWSYTGPAGFIGEVIIAYQASGGGASDTATLTITVENEPPAWEECRILETGEIVTEADDPIFPTGMIIAELGATDADIVTDPLMFGGSGSGLLVLPDGSIQVTDWNALTASALGGAVTMEVWCSDGIETIFSQFVLDKYSPLDVVDQTEIYVKSSSGMDYSPATAAELIVVLENIRMAGNTVTTLILKGHGGEDGIQVGDDGEFLTLAGNDVYFGDEDVTTLLNDVTNTGTSISLRGCNSLPLAKNLKSNLDGASVYGSSWYAIGIPWSRWAIYW